MTSPAVVLARADVPKVCSRCGQAKPIDDFTRNKNSRDGYGVWCKECNRENTRNWRSDPAVRERSNTAHRSQRADPAYREREQAYGRAYRQKWRSSGENNVLMRVNNQKYRYLRRGVTPEISGSFTLQEWKDLCARFDNRCVCCGELKPLVIDHVVPVCRGGANSISNIQPLCRRCNARKNRKAVDYRNRITEAETHE